MDGSVDGLPPGTLALARAYGAAAAARVEGGADELVDGAAAQVLRPLLLAAAAGREAPPRAAPYRLVGGALSADVAAPGDAEQFAALLALSRVEGVGDAEGIAARAQSWRLPVLPFRRRRAGEREAAPRAPVPRAEVHDAASRERLGTLRVLDLSTMWAGPLATRLLADLGATVTRVSFPGRPDGLSRGPGADLFTVLAAGKEEIALDLRVAADRVRFESLVAAADVLVESFSRRVMPNLGYDGAELRRLNPRLLVGSVRAFPGWRAERDWTGYGAGVHAALGLGELPDRTFSGAVVSYPDPLAGLALCRAILTALGRGAGRRAPRTIETSLFEAAEPLLAFGPDPGLVGRPTVAELDAVVAPAPSLA